MDANDEIRANNERRQRERQLVMFGAMLADKEWRAKFSDAWFSDPTMAHALNDLRGGNRTYVNLRSFLAEIGVVGWEAKHGPPLDVLAGHIQADTEINNVLRSVVDLLVECERRTEWGDLSSKLKSLETYRTVIREAAARMPGGYDDSSEEEKPEAL